MNPETQVVTVPKGEVEYIPFGADEKIKLSVAIIQKYVAIPTKSGKLPDDRDCIKFMMLCRARKLNPFEGDCFLQGYDGKDGPQFSLITAHQAFLKRAESSPEFDGMESGVIVENDGNIHHNEGDFLLPSDKLVGAWAKVFFKNRSHPMYKRVNLSTFKKPFGRWVDDPAGMVVKCSESDALRSSFPTLLGGLYGAEEQTIVDVAPVAQAVVAGPQMHPKPHRNYSVTTPATMTPTEDKNAPQGVQTPPPAVPEPAKEAVQPENLPAEEHIDPVAAALSKIKTAGVLESQVMAYLKACKPPIARANQTELAQLSDAKLVNIVGMLDDPEAVAEIKEIK